MWHFVWNAFKASKKKNSKKFFLIAFQSETIWNLKKFKGFIAKQWKHENNWHGKETKKKKPSMHVAVGKHENRS